MSVSISLSDEETEARLAKGVRQQRYVEWAINAFSILFVAGFAWLFFQDPGWSLVHALFFGGMIILVLILSGVSWWIKKGAGLRFPDRQKTRVLYEDGIAMGYDARVGFFAEFKVRPLRIVVTEEELWTTSQLQFLFSFMIHAGNLEHRIAKKDIRWVRQLNRKPSAPSPIAEPKIEICFSTRESDQTIVLRTNKREAFFQALDHDGTMKADGRMNVED